MTKPTGINQFRDTRLAHDITAIHKAIVLDAEVKKIPESTFVNEILPVLTGETINSEFPLLMAAVAGNPFLEVDVVNAQGEIIFRMPALFERDIISHEAASKRGSMASMLITAEMIVRQSPARAEKYLEHEFNGRGIATNREELYKKRLDRFNEILARYGKTLKADGTVLDGKVASTANKEKPQLSFGDDDLL